MTNNNLPYRKNVAAIVLNNKEILIARKPDMGAWQFIQGGIENGESEEEALKRELKEEVGITSFSIIGKSKYTNKYDWPEELQEKLGFKGQVQTFFIVETESRKIALEKKELAEYKWIKFQEVSKLLTYEDTIKVFNKILDEFKDYLK